MDTDQRPIAIEEWRLLQDTIRQQVEIVFKIRGWMIVFLTALAAGMLSEKVQIGVPLCIVFSIAIIFAFLSIELSQLVIQRRARNRCRTVEAALRGETAYEGPRITDRMMTTNYNVIGHIKGCLSELKSPQVYFYSTIIGLSILLVASIALFTPKPPVLQNQSNIISQK